MDYLLIVLAYVLPTFPLAFFWHMKIFADKYQAWGYFGENPSPPLGLLSMLIQGIVLAVGYKWLIAQVGAPYLAVWFILFVGLLHWSVHVLAAMAKNPNMRNVHFLVMETVFLVLQFGIFAFLLGFVS